MILLDNSASVGQQAMGPVNTTLRDAAGILLRSLNAWDHVALFTVPSAKGGLSGFLCVCRRHLCCGVLRVSLVQ